MNTLDEMVAQLTGRADFLEQRGEVKTPGLLRKAAALIRTISAERDHYLSNWKEAQEYLRIETSHAMAAENALTKKHHPARQDVKNDDDYYRPDASGYSRADEEWFFDMDGKP